MKQTITSWTLLMAMLGTSACVKITDKDKGGSAPPVSGVYIEATGAPNQFLVHLPPLGNASEVHRQSESHPEIKATVADLKANETGLLDRHVTAGEKYRYLYVDDDQNVLGSVEVDVPIDLVIDGEIVLSKTPDWHNVYRTIFKKGGVLTTNGYNIVLHTQSLQSEDGVLRTFSENQTAAAGVDGRSGGDIRIFANAAEGTLSFEIRGENGGAGLSPTMTRRSGDNGAIGGNSGSAMIDVILAAADWKTPFKVQQGAGGIGAKGAPAGPVPAFGGSVYNAPAGKDGVNGADGQLGQFCIYQSGRLIDCRQQ